MCIFNKYKQATPLQSLKYHTYEVWKELIETKGGKQWYPLYIQLTIHVTNIIQIIKSRDIFNFCGENPQNAEGFNLKTLVRKAHVIEENSYICYNVIIFMHIFNSLWPSDIIWRQGSKSTLAQVMACCLRAPSRYLNQCWPMISEVLWHSPDSNFTENTYNIYRWNEFEIW